MPGPIEGIRVIDLTGVVMGPYATQILADLGADVIKVEGPTTDSFRQVRPSHHPDMAGVALNLHRNKRSVALNLKNPRGREALLKLVAGADVFVHNMRRAAITRLGLEYSRVKQTKPDIIYCSAYGFGQKGPYRDKAAYDDTIQAGSGIPSLYLRARGYPDYMPAAICDKVAGLTVAYAILAALLGRALGRGGQEIEVPMFETAVTFNLMEHISGYAFEPPLGDFGWQRVLSRLRKPFKTADGYACLMPYSDQNWHDFFHVAGRPELADDPRFSTHAGRIEHTDLLYEIIHDISPKFTTREWMELCDRAQIPAMPSNDLAAMWDDPHLKASGVLGFADHPTEGRYRTIGSPITFSSTPTAITRHAPRVGQDTAQVLAEIGYGSEEIENLAACGATYPPPPDSPR